MGTYVNPASESMQKAVNSEIYVDKTGLLKILNNAIGTEKCYFAVSRARRFGKSMAAGMIDAYYSRGCDSRELFSPYEIAKDPDFEKYLNKYKVLHFDVATYFNAAKTPEEIIPRMDSRLLREMIEEFPYLKKMKPSDTAEAIDMVYKKEQIQFVIIIDEYDCIVRDDPDNGELIRQYLKYLRGFFKTEESKRFLALGYNGTVEAESYLGRLPEGVSLLGMYSYGEFCPVGEGEFCNVFHNSTFTILCM